MLGNGFLPMFVQGGAAANPWTGATWAMSGGNAYNVPTLGAELLTDGGLENWASATNLTGWTESVSGTSTVNREGAIVQAGSNSVRLDIDALGSLASILQTILATNGDWITMGWYGRSSASGKQIRVAFAGVTSGPARDPGTTWTSYTDVIRSVAANPSIQILRVAGASFSASLYADSISAKKITTPTLFAAISGASSTQTAAAKIATLTDGTQSGVVALLDSVSNPQNFLNAYVDRGTVKLDKCVAGTYTNLVSVTVAFTAGAKIEIRRPSGNTFQLWYGGVQRGADQTVADTSIINNTRYGLFSTHSGGTFSEFSLDGVVIPFTLPGA